MRPKIFVICAFCGKEFLRYQYHAKESAKLNHRAFCSSYCQAELRTKQEIFICENTKCNKEFKRCKSQISKHNFCSQSCSARVNNLLKIKTRTCANLSCNKAFSGERKYCTNSCQPLPKQYSREEVLNKIKILAVKLGRTPTQRECSQRDSGRKYFGSWNNAILAAGLRPYRSKSQRMFKRTQTYARDGHFCYSVSELLIDNWLTDHAIDHQKEFPYPGSRYVADWSVDNNQIFVEYFGLANDVQDYDITIGKKKIICQKYGIKLIGIYPKDIYPLKNLEKKMAILFNGAS